jgi:hypothetical protein
MEILFVLALDLVFLILIMFVISYGVSQINYFVDECYVGIQVGSLAIRKIHIDDLQAVEIGTHEWVEAWANTLSRKKIKEKGVTLYRKTGGLRKVVLTPEDPRQFVARLRMHPRFQPAGVLKAVPESFQEELTMNNPNRLIEKWPWNEEQYLLFLWIPVLLSLVGGIILIPLYGLEGLAALIGIPAGILWWLIYAFVGRKVVALKREYASKAGELAECLSQIGYIEAPGIAIFDGSNFKIVQIVGREALIPFSEIESVRVGRRMPGKYLFGKRAFVFRTKQYKRISFAVPESIGRKWSKDLARSARKKKP